MASERNKYDEIESAFRMWKQGVETPDKVPDGWFTARDFAASRNAKERDAQKVIRDLLDMGLLEAKKFRIKTGTRLYPVIHYKTCKRTKKTP